MPDLETTSVPESRKSSKVSVEEYQESEFEIFVSEEWFEENSESSDKEEVFTAMLKLFGRLTSELTHESQKLSEVDMSDNEEAVPVVLQETLDDSLSSNTSLAIDSIANSESANSEGQNGDVEFPDSDISTPVYELVDISEALEECLTESNEAATLEAEEFYDVELEVSGNSTPTNKEVARGDPPQLIGTSEEILSNEIVGQFLEDDEVQFNYLELQGSEPETPQNEQILSGSEIIPNLIITSFDENLQAENSDSENGTPDYTGYAQPVNAEALEKALIDIVRNEEDKDKASISIDIPEDADVMQTPNTQKTEEEDCRNVDDTVSQEHDSQVVLQGVIIDPRTVEENAKKNKVRFELEEFPKTGIVKSLVSKFERQSSIFYIGDDEISSLNDEEASSAGHSSEVFSHRDDDDLEPRSEDVRVQEKTSGTRMVCEDNCNDR